MQASNGDLDPNLSSLGDYAIRIAREGFATIQQISSGEIFHLRSAPMEEARSLYLEQSGLAGMLTPSSKPLVVWDVGLGAAANAMAAIQCYEEQAAKAIVRPMTIISFDNDLRALELALDHVDSFPYLRHPGPPAILRKGEWRSEKHTDLLWLLVQGDFATTVSTTSPAPDLIFYDMFSSKTYPQNWSLEIFQRLFAVCAGRATKLVTYTRSTSARAALLGAGFFVARGRASGAQEESTIAMTPTAAVHACDLLDCTWLGRWERSRAKYPALLPIEKRTAFERLIRDHPQFASCASTHTP